MRAAVAIKDEVSQGRTLAQVDAPGCTYGSSRAGVEIHMLSSSTGVYAAYFDGKGPARISLDLPAGSYHGEWMNTETGAATQIPEVPSSGRPLTLRRIDARTPLKCR